MPKPPHGEATGGEPGPRISDCLNTDNPPRCHDWVQDAPGELWPGGQERSVFFELLAGIGEALSFARFKGSVHAVSVLLWEPLIVSVSFEDHGLRTVVVDVDFWAEGTVPAPSIRERGFDLGLQQIAEPGEWNSSPSRELLEVIACPERPRLYRIVGNVEDSLRSNASG